MTSAELGAPARMLRGEHVNRVLWLPGTDVLRGACFCGAERDAEDPVELWEWLIAHPDHGRAQGRNRVRG